jgi:hypothetical protein
MTYWIYRLTADFLEFYVHNYNQFSLTNIYQIKYNNNFANKFDYLYITLFYLKRNVFVCLSYVSDLFKRQCDLITKGLNKVFRFQS